MKKRVLLIFIMTVVAVFTSCFPIETDDNELLENTEWATRDHSQGLKFFNNGQVVFFWTYANGSGSYIYNASSQHVTFTNLTIVSQGIISEFTSAEILGDGTMKLYWHDVGNPENYYMILYRIR